MTTQKVEGLTCPKCGSLVQITEGVRISQCSYCGQYALLRGEQGVTRFQVPYKVSREQALASVRDFFNGARKAADLKESAEIGEIFLVYAPYWRVKAFVVGWVFGRLGQYRKTKLIEEEVMREIQWNDAAADMAEYGVHRIALPDKGFEPFNPESLHQEAIIFEAVESPTEAMTLAKRDFIQRAKKQRAYDVVDSIDIQLLSPKLSLVYYPFWVVRYEYHQRTYQVTVDGVRGEVLYGKAPGNNAYRARSLVTGMAVGTFFAANGIVVLYKRGSIYLKHILAMEDIPGYPMCVLPLVFAMVYFGIKILLTGYRKFRYGDEVEEISSDARKV